MNVCVCMTDRGRERQPGEKGRVTEMDVNPPYAIACTRLPMPSACSPETTYVCTHVRTYVSKLHKVH